MITPSANDGGPEESAPKPTGAALPASAGIPSVVHRSFEERFSALLDRVEALVAQLTAREAQASAPATPAAPPALAAPAPNPAPSAAPPWPLTVAQYAALRGVTPQSVNAWGRAGVLAITRRQGTKAVITEAAHAAFTTPDEQKSAHYSRSDP